VPALAGAAAVAVPVMTWLIRVESRLTRLETVIGERLPAPKFNAPA